MLRLFVRGEAGGQRHLDDKDTAFAGDVADPNHFSTLTLAPVALSHGSRAGDGAIPARAPSSLRIRSGPPTYPRSEEYIGAYVRGVSPTAPKEQNGKERQTCCLRYLHPRAERCCAVVDFSFWSDWSQGPAPQGRRHPLDGAIP